MAGYIGSKAVNLSTTGADINGDANIDGDLSFRDNDKAIFGAGSDLQIYHDGSNSYISDQGTGNIILDADDSFQVKRGANTSAYFDTNAEVTLYHNNASKLATTSTGVDITGVLTSDGLNVSAASPNIDVTDTGTSHASQDFLTNSNAVRATIGVERSAGGGLFVGSSPYAAVFGTASAGNTEFATNNNVRMTIDSSGTVLVGKSATNSDVVGVEAAQDGHVYVTVNNTLPLYINRQSGDEMLRFASNGTTVGSIASVGGSDIKLVLSSDGDQYITGNAASNYMTFSAANAERMRIDSSGNVGIGTSSPNDKLTISGSAAYMTIDRSDGEAGVTFRYNGDNTKRADIATQTNGDLSFRTNLAEAMRIDSSGNVGIGTSSTSLTNSRSAVYIGSSGGVLRMNHSTANGSGDGWIEFGYNGTKIGSITQNGTTATSYNTSSDYRLKTDAQPMTNASARVQALNPVNFEWIADGTRVDGFLAHEAQAVVPEAVTGEKDAVDADGNPEYQGIDQSKLVPLLTAALQEALDEITDLKARVATLEAN